MGDRWENDRDGRGTKRLNAWGCGARRRRWVHGSDGGPARESSRRTAWTWEDPCTGRRDHPVAGHGGMSMRDGWIRWDGLAAREQGPGWRHDLMHREDGERGSAWDRVARSATRSTAARQGTGLSLGARAVLVRGTRRPGRRWQRPAWPRGATFSESVTQPHAPWGRCSLAFYLSRLVRAETGEDPVYLSAGGRVGPRSDQGCTPGHDNMWIEPMPLSGRGA